MDVDDLPGQRTEFWEPTSSDEGGALSDDSMTDLYPPELFTERELLKPEDFQTDQQEKPKQSEKSTAQREAKVGHKRGRKLRKKELTPLTKKFKSHHHKPKNFSSFKQLGS